MIDELVIQLENSGAKLVRANGNQPSLIIVGQDHDESENLVDLSFVNPVFDPEYVLIEAVAAGKVASPQQLQELSDAYAAKKPKTPAKNTFERFAYESIYDPSGWTSPIKWGVSGFAGMDIATLAFDEKKLERAASRVFNNMGKRVQYRFGKSGVCGTVYDYLTVMKAVSEELPNTDRFGRTIEHYEQALEKFNRGRETTMGCTMASYAALGRTIAPVGAYHITPDSQIYPLLINSGVSFLAFDISKTVEHNNHGKNGEHGAKKQA